MSKKKSLKSYVDDYTAGKGDNPRFFPDKQYRENYDKIFRKNKGKNGRNKIKKKEDE
jgi:hypothetical protein